MLFPTFTSTWCCFPCIADSATGFLTHVVTDQPLLEHDDINEGGEVEAQKGLEFFFF
jgi:hypothetical protein